MKIMFSAIFIVMIAVSPLRGQTPANTAHCIENPLDCLRFATIYVENDERGTGNLAGLRLAYAGALSRSGAFSEAESIAAILERPRDSALAYAVLAQEQAKAGLVTQASESIAKAIADMGRIQYELIQIKTLIAIISAQVTVGDLAGANINALTVLAFIDTQEPGRRRSDPIERLVKTGVLFQEIEMAQALTNSIASEHDRIDAIIAIANYLALEGQHTLALNEVMQIEQPELRTRALVSLSFLLAEMGESERAREATDNALRAAISGKTNTSRAFAMIRTVRALANLGDETAAASLLARAMVEAKGGMSRTSYSRFLIELADAYSISGFHNQAIEALEASLRTAEGIEDENVRIFPLAEVAGAFAKYGAANRAFDMFWEAEDLDTQTLRLIFIADSIQ